LNIAFLGATGSGKTTLAKYVAQKYNLEMINAGAVLDRFADTHPKLKNLIFNARTTGATANLPQEILMRTFEPWRDKQNYVVDNLATPSLLHGFNNLDLIFHLAINAQDAWKRSEKASREIDRADYFKNRSVIFEKNLSAFRKIFGAKIIEINASAPISKVQQTVTNAIENMFLAQQMSI
jgi:adenylate kinase family enzyme